jgi:ATP-dependent exoDNAse (exonuclease V) beta subunit
MTAIRELTDAAARDAIRRDTGRTLFVEAGAGSGKTTRLVSRIQTLVVDDGVPIDAIAAVTFTERAGAELRDRLRARLENAAHYELAKRPDRAALADKALDGLDTAAIGTLHSFAQRILAEHPIEAGIPPLVEVLDEVASSVAFEARWTALRTELLDSDEMAPTLELALAVGIKLEHVRALITRLNADWDLVEQHVVAPGQPPMASAPDVTALRAEAERLASMADRCSDPDDKFVQRLESLAQWTAGLATAGDDTTAQLTALRAAAELKFSFGRKANWGGALDQIRSDCEEWKASAARLVGAVVEMVLRSLVHWCGIRVLAAAQERRGDGRLEFHDLLVLTRNLLRDDAEVRAALQQRYQRLLLDEFQDTDPIQIEIATRIAGGAAATQDRWEDVVVPPGSLFVVGDPKQSIYRFRRADIAMYLRAQRVIGDEVSLTTNFRTVAPILRWVNEVFGTLIRADAEKQPHYQPLDLHRGEPTVGDPVTVVGAEEHPGKVAADELRELEADDVVRAIVRALDEGWTTQESVPPTTPGGEETTRWRPMRAGDITVLLPARTSLPFLEAALDAAGVLYRTESSSLVYHAAEVRDLFAAVRAIADPSDAFALVTTLRSPLFGCGDDDLWTWKRGGGVFHLLAPVPDGLASHPVGQAIAYLKRLHRRSRWMTPSEVLGAIAVDRRMFEVAVFGPRARDSWRRLRFVIDQARAWSEVEHGGLRSYLAWAAAQSVEGSRVAEAVLPETDTDSVRIMTVHAAKGLEFPMVVLSGMTSAPNPGRGVRFFWKDDGYAVALGKGLETDDFQDQVPLDEQMGSYERLRLMYVAATRARDHLVVSLHRSGKRDTNARQLADAGAGTAADAVVLPDDVGETVRTRERVPVAPPPDFDRWFAEVSASAEASRVIPAQSASGLEGTDPEVALAGVGQPPDALAADDSASEGFAQAEVADASDLDEVAGTAKGGRDVELPAWSKGRYGSAVGRAVHGVLQVVDLATGTGLDDAVAAQCVAEGVVEFAPLVRDLAHSALESDVLQRAAARPHWRESYVGTVQPDGTVLEGFVDLIYREDDGSLVIVDYKTDDVPDAAVPSRVVYYAPQVRAYADMLSCATDEPPARTTLLFTRPGSATAVDVEEATP